MSPTNNPSTSRSALVTLRLPPSSTANDPLLALVASLSPPYQTTIITNSKKEPLSLTSGPDTLTHRNAILRCLCGMGLHNALDTLGGGGGSSTPLLLLGGHSAPSQNGASPTSTMAMAGISSWMSVASSIRSGVEDASSLLGQLDGYLSTRSYLVPSASATLADYDLYLAIVTKVSAGSGETSLESMVKGYGNTTRWLEQVGVSLEELVGIAKGNGSKLDVPTMPKGLEVKGRPLPVFFYGDEDESLVNAAAVSVASSGGGNATGGQKKDGAKAGGGKGSPAAAAASTGEAGGLTEAQKKAAADKRAAKAATKSAKKAKQPTPADTAAAEKDIDISALDIRVGKIIRAWEHESAEKLYCEEIDVGEDSPRKIASGLRPFYKLDEMQDRMVLVLCNLKARNLVGFPSHGMVLCASNADHTAVEFAVPPPTAKIGDRVMFDGITGEPEAENKVAKKKMFEVLAPDLKTDEGGVVVWKGKRSCVGESGESCRAVGGMAGAQVS